VERARNRNWDLGENVESADTLLCCQFLSDGPSSENRGSRNYWGNAVVVHLGILFMQGVCGELGVRLRDLETWRLHALSNFCY